MSAIHVNVRPYRSCTSAGRPWSRWVTIGHIAALAGVGKTTVRTAVQQAVRRGLFRSEESLAAR